MIDVIFDQPPAITMEALEAYLLARDAYLAGLSDLDRAMLRLQKERSVQEILGVKDSG